MKNDQKTITKKKTKEKEDE